MPALSQERVDEIFDGAADFKQLEYEKAEAKEEQVNHLFHVDSRYGLNRLNGRV